MAKLFVVEDSASQAALLRHLLVHAGHEVSLYTNGLEALEAMDGQPDLILSDLTMPIMDGLELCAALKANPSFQHIPFVLISVSDRLDMLVNGLHAGADGYLIKPYNHAVLLETVNRLLDKNPADMSVMDANPFVLGNRLFKPDTDSKKIFDFFTIAFLNSSVQARVLDEKEKSLRETNAALSRNIDLLAASEERFRSLIEAIPDIVYKIDAEGNFTYINNSISRLGYEPSELIGRHFSELLCPEDVATASAESVLPKLSNQRPEASPKLFDERRTRERMTLGLRVRLISKNRLIKIGEIHSLSTAVVHVEINSLGMYGENPKLGRKYIGSVGVIRDITERLGFEQELRAAKEAADAASRAKSEFLSSMSHELRTPLNAIMGFGQLLDKPDHPLDTDQREILQHMLNSGEHLLKLIDEVLDLSRIEAGYDTLEIVSTDPAPLLETCLKLLEKSAVAMRLRVVDMLDRPLPNLLVDGTRFKQVLLNLLSNAIKYNRQGGTVTLKCEKHSDQFLRFFVEDTGIGIHENRLSELFQPFNRLGMSASDVEGTGIGLVTTQRIMKKMGGDIGVSSQYGVGSRFWVDFVIDLAWQPQHNEHAVVSPFVSEQERLPAPQRLINVLYVEDNPVNAVLMQNILTRIGNVNLHVTKTAEEGIQYATIYRPDLILMDIRLPGMDGVEATDYLKSQPETAAIPVIAVTAEAMLHDAERAKRADFCAYVTKPFSLAVLSRVLVNAVS